MNKEQLLLRAKELGIKDAESLKTDELKAAVKAAELRLDLVKRAKALGVKHTDETMNEELAAAISQAETWNELVLKAEALGIKDVDGLSNEELSTLILATENSKLSEQNDLLVSKMYVLAGVLGIENYSDLDVDALTLAANERLTALTAVTGTEEVAEKPAEGKTDKAFKSENGKEYQFKDAAPAAFRFMSVVKTQIDWLRDKEAMELMIVGNVSYVELKRK